MIRCESVEGAMCYFGLERAIADVLEHLPSDIKAVVAYCPRPRKGVWNRVVNIFWAWLNHGDINHITGDVHHLTFVLRTARFP
jgi:hypothetical protein